MTQKKYSWTTQEQPPKMSGGHLWDWRAYKYWQNFPSSGLGNCRVLAHIINVLCMWKVNSKEKKFSTSHWEISVSCTSQECDMVATTFFMLYNLASGCLPQVKKKQFFCSKSGWGCLQSGCLIIVMWLHGNWKNWSPRKGGCNQRFNCTS